MKKLLMTILIMVMMVGCLNPEYVEDSSISKFTLDNYRSILDNNSIDEFKCTPAKSGYRVYYFTSKRPNDYPATILIEGINGTYKVLFDKEYKLIPKDILFADIHGCFKELKKVLEVDNTWK